MPVSVTVEGGGSGSYLDCFSDASLESLFEGSFRFADVTGFTVVACQLVYSTTPHLSWGWSLSLGATRMLLMVVWGLAWAATPVFLIRREMGSVMPPM